MEDGSITVTMLAPHRDLAASVQTYWILRATRILAPLLRYMHPDGGSGITLNFGEVVWIGDVPRPHGVSAAARVFVPEALRIYGNVRIVGNFHGRLISPFWNSRAHGRHWGFRK